MDIVAGPDIVQTQARDGGSGSKLMEGSLEAHHGNAVRLVDGQLLILNVVAVCGANIAVDHRNTGSEQLAEDTLISLGAIRQAVIVGAEVHDH